MYDSVGRISSETESDGMSIAYTYDRFSNRSSMTVTGGDENYTTTYVYDAANRLITETKSYEFSDEITSYYYDLNGNQVSKVKEYLVDEEGPGEADYELIAGLEETELYAYNGLNQLVEVWKDEETYAYAYNTSGIRVSKDDGTTETKFVLDGGNVILELVDDEVTANYVRGMNLVYAEIDGSTSYYLYNAHGDVVDLTTTTGAVVKSYDYDAFGNEKTPTANDTNPFRYCGEYWDDETGTYYLRARCYNPSIGRFSQQDTHWNTSNMIYGDDPVKWNEREPNENPKDPLGVTTYTYVPDISSILQSGNLYNYCMGNPILHADPNGQNVITFVLSNGETIVLGVMALIALILTGDTQSFIGAKTASYGGTSITGDDLADFFKTLLGIAAVGVSVEATMTEYFGEVATKEEDSTVSEFKPHSSKKRKSTENKHQEGETRVKRDQGGEKGDARRRGNPNKRKK